jgi:ligand-binding sensor domain-containing protein
MKRLVRVPAMGSVVALLILLGAMMAPPQSQAQDSDWVWANFTHDKDVWALAPRGQVLWAGTFGGGLLRWDLMDGSYTKFTPADGFTGSFVYDIAVDGQGRAWVGHDRGLSVCDDTACTSYDKDNSGIPGGEVEKVVAASDGRIWLASRDSGGLGEGVTVYDGATWTTYTTSNGLYHNRLYSMAEDLNGHLWFGHQDDEVTEFDGVSSWTIHYNVSLSSWPITGIAADNSGNVWFVTQNVAVLFDGTYFYRYYPLEPPTNPYLQDIATDAAGHPWIASLTGLWTFDGANWTGYDTGNSGLLSDTMRAVAAQGQTVWVGYADSTQADGLAEFDGASWSHYETVDGFPGLTGQFGAATDIE